ncbi:MAG: pyridoxamine 5'-phosphate oxidase family protein [Gammaproteobacteria bacterium]
MNNTGPAAMTQPEIDAFLGGTPRYCAFGSLRRDGSPSVIPVGFLYEGGAINLTFRPDHAAIRRVRRDPRVSVTVFNDHFPVQFVLVNGLAEVREDPGLEFSIRKHRWIMQLAEDWLDQDAFERNHFEPGRVVVRIPVAPGNVMTSDMTKIPLPVAPGRHRPGW